MLTIAAILALYQHFTRRHKESERKDQRTKEEPENINSAQSAQNAQNAQRAPMEERTHSAPNIIIMHTEECTVDVHRTQSAQSALGELSA